MKREHNRSYSCLVMLAFIRNLGKECSSIKKLIEVSDRVGDKIGFDINISYDTKLAIVNDMINRGLLAKGEKTYSQPVTLGSKVESYIVESLVKKDGDNES